MPDPVLSRFLDESKELLPSAVLLRRRIHENPELGLDLPLTTQAVLDGLQGLDIEIARGASTSGLIVSLTGTKPWVAKWPDDPIARRYGRFADAGRNEARICQQSLRAHARLRP